MRGGQWLLLIILVAALLSVVLEPLLRAPMTRPEPVTLQPVRPFRHGPYRGRPAASFQTHPRTCRCPIYDHNHEQNGCPT